ncbi:11384_t:CDS:2 [Diversispora eburnea]|uniref:11384_t:CDS:1 n=1 Tax=Diversispora eburnea TaxID=1213867 RepID=A0A9N9AHF7_9GLOM|nr:11384_t:CDS:2 [Diversispora eburnea]
MIRIINDRISHLRPLKKQKFSRLPLIAPGSTIVHQQQLKALESLDYGDDSILSREKENKIEEKQQLLDHVDDPILKGEKENKIDEIEVIHQHFDYVDDPIPKGEEMGGEKGGEKGEKSEKSLIDVENKTGEEVWIHYKSLSNKFKDKLQIKDFNKILGIFLRNLSIDPVFHDRMLTILDEINYRMKPDESTYNTMMSMSLQRKNLEEMKYYFDIMQDQKIQPNTITYNVMITAIVRIGKAAQAFALYDDMRKKGIERNQKTFTMLIQACVKTRDVKQAKSLYNDMLREGIIPDVIIYNTLINVTARNATNLKELEPAFNFVEEMKQKGITPITSTYSILVKSLIEMGKRTEALQIFNQMEKDGCKPDALILEGIGLTGLKSLIKMRDTYNITPSNEDYNTFINQAIRESKFNDAAEILRIMLQNGFQPDVSTYSIIINAHIKNNDISKAMQLYNAMKIDNIKSDSYIFSALIIGYVMKKEIDQAFKLIDEMLNSHVELNNRTINRIIDTASEHQDINIIQKVFDRLLRMTNPDKVAFERVLWRVAQSGQLTMVENYLILMEKYNHKIDFDTYKSIITGSCKGLYLSEGLYWYQRMINLKLRPNHLLLSTLLRCHAEPKYSNKMFVLWNDFHYFGILPDDEDIMFVLLICREIGSWQMENRILRQLKDLGYNTDTYKTALDAIDLQKIGIEKIQGLKLNTGAIELWIKQRKMSINAYKKREIEIKNAKENLQKWANKVGIRNEAKLDTSAKKRVNQWLPYSEMVKLRKKKEEEAATATATVQDNTNLNINTK